jgi:hypothetical protein
VSAPTEQYDAATVRTIELDGRCVPAGNPDAAGVSHHAPGAHPPERFDETTGEILDSDAPDNGGWDKERHCITDLRGANWAGRKLRVAEEQIALNAAMAEAELEELARKVRLVRERQDKADAPFRATAVYFQNALTVYASTPEGRTEVLKGLRKKSRLLPCGVTIGWEKRGGQLRLQEAPDARERVIAWARANCPETTEQRWEVDVAAVKKAAGTGQIPDGMERPPVVDELFVSVGEEESK